MMEEKVWEFMRVHQMTEEGDRIVLGVSGGPDSMALLYVLYSLRERLGVTLAAVHVNHCLRGEEADKDQKLVEKECRKMGIVCRTFSMDVEKLAGDWGVGLEEAGRRARCQAFTQFLREWGGTKTAVAHHRDDLAETVLHHLCRGTGLTGLGGIRPVHGVMIRPLLCLERQEIEHYIEEQQIPSRTDASNLEDGYTRNRLRHHVIPYLKQEINPQAVAHIAHAAQVSREADDYLVLQAQSVLEGYAPYRGREFIRLPLPFFGEPRIIQMYALRQIVFELSGKQKDVTSLHLEKVCELAKKTVGKTVPLPYHMYARRSYGAVLMGVSAETQEEGEPSGETACEEISLPEQGTAETPWGTFSCRIFSWDGQEILEKKYTKWFDYDKIKSSLHVRTRRSKDYLVVNPSGGRKKLKDYLIDCKIPREDRDSLPLLASESEILWVVGYRIGETGKITEATSRVWEVRYEGGSKDEREYSGIDFGRGSR